MQKAIVPCLIIVLSFVVCISVQSAEQTEQVGSGDLAPSVFEWGLWEPHNDDDFWNAPQHYKSLDDLPEPLPRLDDRSRSVLANADGLLEVKPVVEPHGDLLLSYNDHFGHPIATVAGKTIIVVFTRLPQHASRPDKPDQFSSSACMTRSTDGGQTWSNPIDLNQYVHEPTRNCVVNYMRAIGTASDGAVIFVNEKGVFRSEDEGATWEHLSGALGEGQVNGPVVNLGPTVINHPQYGLLIAGHVARLETKKRTEYNTPYVPPDLWFYYSKDGGHTWQQEHQAMPDWAVPCEPELLMTNVGLLVVARCHGPESYDPDKHIWHYMQLFSKSGVLPMDPSMTNMCVGDIRHVRFPTYLGPTRLHGPWSQDTVDLGLNPVTQRIECVATNRNGGGENDVNDLNIHSLNLWSIAPEDLAAGSSTWRFEGTLLRVKGLVGRMEVDGMHPAAAVIDAERGVQHIFIYSGYYKGPSSIFRVTRTLETDKLREYLSQQ